jgi:hypothetical protein
MLLAVFAVFARNYQPNYILISAEILGQRQFGGLKNSQRWLFFSLFLSKSWRYL